MFRLTCLLSGWLAILGVSDFVQTPLSAQGTPDDPSKAQPDPAPNNPVALRIADQALSRQDKNSDGQLSREEAGGMFKSRFAQFDQDSDGFLTRKELETVLSRLIRITQGSRNAALFAGRKPWSWPERPRPDWDLTDDVLPTEILDGEGIWIDPALERAGDGSILVTVWFERQFLGDGKAYLRRSQEFSGQRRQELSAKVVNTLKTLSQKSFQAAEPALRKLTEHNKVQMLQWHWIVNGFSCVTTAKELPALKEIPGIKKIFVHSNNSGGRRTSKGNPVFVPPAEKAPFDPDRYQHPWYHRYLLADRTWKQLGVTGAGTLNVIMDGNFVLFPHVTENLYRNPNELPDNGKDDDRNGLIDDYHGYNFSSNNPTLELVRANSMGNLSVLHGSLCAAEICGSGTEDSPYEFGLAPSANWAGVIAGWNTEAAYEWAIEQEAETISMSFSYPSLGELRSHWRKMIEQAAFCGVYSVSGAGNFAGEGTRAYAPIPIQMRTPEDIPLAVFAPAGVQRNFERTPFSSQGPVQWETEHYQDGLVQKPDFCAFNMGLPVILPNGTVIEASANGNSFAGPMMAGTLALMLSADPDLLPWDAREILIQTATDVGDPGFDHQTGHGLLNCYRAVKEVLRRKAVREGKDSKPFEGREKNDELDVLAVQQEVKKKTEVVVGLVVPNSAAAKVGVRVGDVLKSIGNVDIEKPSDVQPAIARARESKHEQETFVILRADKKMEISVAIPSSGGIGIKVSEAILKPVFK